MIWSIAELYSKNISYLHTTWMNRTSFLWHLSHIFVLAYVVCELFMVYCHNFHAYYSFGQDVLLSPDPLANVLSLFTWPAHVKYFCGRQLWIKTLWVATDLSGSWKGLVWLLSGALGQGHTKARNVKVSGCCMISCNFGEQIQRKSGFSQACYST